MSQVVISNKVFVGPDKDYDDILTLYGPSDGWVAIGTSYKAYQSAACTAVRPDGFTPTRSETGSPTGTYLAVAWRILRNGHL